jgi:hypothetical protein
VGRFYNRLIGVIPCIRIARQRCVGPGPKPFAKTMTDRVYKILVRISCKKLLEPIDSDRCDYLEKVWVVTYGSSNSAVAELRNWW